MTRLSKRFSVYMLSGLLTSSLGSFPVIAQTTAAPIEGQTAENSTEPEPARINVWIYGSSAQYIMDSPSSSHVGARQSTEKIPQADIPAVTGTESIKLPVAPLRQLPRPEAASIKLPGAAVRVTTISRQDYTKSTSDDPEPQPDGHQASNLAFPPVITQPVLPEISSTSTQVPDRPPLPLLPAPPLDDSDSNSSNPNTLLTPPTPPMEQTHNSPPPRKILINVAARQLSFYRDGKLVKVFPVGVGRPQFPTPLGNYAVIRKMRDPGWENPYLPEGKKRIMPGMDNPLGTRWIGFKNDGRGEYGIHGTDDPPSVGKYASHGCVRMYVRDAEQLFDWVTDATPVQVVYQPVVVSQRQNRLHVTIYPDTLRKGYPTWQTVQQRIVQIYPSAKINLPALQALLKTRVLGSAQAVAELPSNPTGDQISQK